MTAKHQFDPKYLYSRHSDADGQTPDCIFLHPVRKVTDRFVYVEKGPWWGFWTPTEGDQPSKHVTSEGTYKLNRAELERKGYANLGKSFGWWMPTFYLSPERLYEGVKS
jgi:hypothetical protein